MPIYEYLCDSCDHKMEALQKISDDPLKTCPECSEDSLRKLVSAAAFRLKGAGWYETDFKGDQDKQKNLAKSDDKPVSSSKKDDKKDTKSPDSSKSDSNSTKTKSDSVKSGTSKPKKTPEKTAD